MGPIGPGAPAENTATTFYFTGRSDNFHPGKKSTYSGNARLDPESIRVSKDGKTVFISDEYGPYVYEFDRTSGRRIRSISLPAKLPVRPSPTKKDEIKGNNSGRTANKGMEGLAITPAGKTLVGIMQAPLLQDSHNGAKKLLRIIIIDIARGDKADRPEYGYKLTLGTGVSEILAINDHQFLVLERDDKGLGDDPEAKVKRLFAVDLSNPRDIANLSGAEAEAAAVPKTEFLNIVKMLKMQGIETPEKIEGLAFGPDVMFNGARKHTLFVANDNDFIPDSAEKNHFFVFGFDDSDLPNYTPQRFADEK